MIDLFNFAVATAQNGFGYSGAGLAIVQGATGAFFACSGFNKLFNRERHATIVETLKRDKVPFVGFNQWFVPGNEFVGGIALVLNIFPAFFATALFILLCVACKAEAWGRVKGYAPINRVDTLCDVLYLPEVIYLVALAAIIIG